MISLRNDFGSRPMEIEPPNQCIVLRRPETSQTITRNRRDKTEAGRIDAGGTSRPHCEIRNSRRTAVCIMCVYIL